MKLSSSLTLGAVILALPLIPFGNENAPESESHEPAKAEKHEPAKTESHGPAKVEKHEQKKAVKAAAVKSSGIDPEERRKPRPDTTFANAAEWDGDEAEILAYSVKKTSPSGELQMEGQLATERLFMHVGGEVGKKRDANDDREILNAALLLSWKEDSVPRSIETVAEFPRAGAFSLLRQEQSLQSWPSVSYRSLDCRVTPPHVRVLSSGGETSLDMDLKEWPVYTDEMLFTYLRALPQRAGYREEVWLIDGDWAGHYSPKAQYAAITVRSRAPAIRDMETWYVTVDREDGKRSEFWLSASGLHPVVMAIPADGSVWTLQGISHRKYRTW
jgi:hypothetical protein